MSIVDTNYYWFQSALTDEQCNSIIERGLSDMTLTEQKAGKKATDATTFDFRQKGGEISNAGSVAANNLTNEGYPYQINDTKKQKIILSGDVMFDALAYYQESASKINLINDIPLEDKNLITCTIHRESNTNDNDLLEGILDELIDLSKTFKIIFLVHPRLKKSKLISNKKFQDSNIVLSDPLGYLEMQRLLMSSKFVITDSGGLQKEAYLHKIPCLTLRDETEWQETVTSGWNILTNPRENKLVDVLNSFKLDLNNYENFYGDGNASQKIVDGLIEYT